MATEPREMEDMARIAGVLLVNIGTMRVEALEGMLLAGMCSFCMVLLTQLTRLVRYFRQQVSQTHCFRPSWDGSECI
jgi:hypothetical protein